MICRRPVRALILLGLLTSGCYAGIRAYEDCVNKEVPPSCQDAPAGLRYFLSVPYLIIEERPNNQWSARVELVVDRSREFTLQPYAFLAKSTATVQFNPDGTLKSFQLDQDTTDIPEAVLNGLKEVQLKRLELEKAALDKRVADAEAAAKATEKPGAAGKGVVLQGAERKAYMLRIEGDTVKWRDRARNPVSILVPATLDVSQEEAPSDGCPPGDKPLNLTWMKKNGKIEWLKLSIGDVPLGTNTPVEFLDSSKNALDEQKSKELKDKLVRHERGLRIKRDLIIGAKVKWIKVCEREATLPNEG